MLYLARKLTGNKETLKTIYYSLVQPYFDYCDVVWGVCPSAWACPSRSWFVYAPGRKQTNLATDKLGERLFP